MNITREKCFHYLPRLLLVPILFVFSRILITCLSTDEIAQFALFQASYALIITVFPASIYNLFLRELSKYPFEDVTYKYVEVLYSFFCVPAFIFILVGSFLAPYAVNVALSSDKLSYPYLFSFLLFLLGILGFFNGSMRAIFASSGRRFLVSGIDAIEGLLKLSALFVVFSLTPVNLYILILILVLSSLVSFILRHFYLPKELSFMLNPSWYLSNCSKFTIHRFSLIRSDVKAYGSFVMPSLIGWFQSSFDKFFLALIAGPEFLATYYILYTVIFTPISHLSGAVLEFRSPIICKVFNKSQLIGVRSYLQKQFSRERYSLLLVFVATYPAYFFVKSLFIPNAGPGLSLAVFGMLLCSVLFYMSQSASQCLVACLRPSLIFNSKVISLVAYIISSLLLIPYFGLAGQLIAIIIMYGLCLYFQVRFIYS